MIPCSNCPKKYVGQTGRKLSTRLHEHQLAVKRHDQLSLISSHEDMANHKFDLAATKIIGQAHTKHSREFLEAWLSTSECVNRHIELDPSYQPLRSRDLSRQTHS